VIVQYGPKHDVDSEWVYNDPDIDGAEIVWARDMGAEKNEELLKYFRDRRTWLLHADDSPARLTPYPQSDQQ